MCGICGFTQATSADAAALKAMCDIMAHRGPDGEGQYLDAESGIALGHRRLSLIDLANGNQPMVRATREHDSAITSPALMPDGTPCGTPESVLAKGDFAIVFNGEIYNYQDLRAELETQGWQFKTKSDTEVLLTGYLAWGEGVLDRLRGMFAFAIWNRATRELFCARDFFGIKPFYYTQQNGRFIFASEIKCILEHPDYARELNREALEQYLCFQFSALPETFFKGIFKLAPAHCMTVRADGTLDASAGQYELPVASDTTLGGVKVSNSDYTNSRSFPVVTRNGEHLALSFKLGDNAMPDGIEFHGTENTTIGLKKATSTALGVVKPDGTTITADTDGTISAFTATASTLMGEGGATMGDALEVAPGIWLCIIRQWVITTQGGYYDAFSFSVYDRAGSRIALAASPTAGTYLILPVAGNARTKEYNYDTLMGKWVCTTTNTSDTAKPDPCTLLLRARA